MQIKNLIKKIVGVSNIKFIKSWFQSTKDKNRIENRRLFYIQFLKPNSVFFDIGANYGNRIEPLINEKIKIVAVEPQEECIQYLRKKYEDKITILKNGVGKKREDKIMYISKNANILSSFSEDWIKATKLSGRFKKITWNETRTIKMITLDYLIETYGKPAFIKIDVEGYELEVLKGLSNKVDVLSIEYTVPERKETLLECLDYLNNLSSSDVMFNYCITENTKFALKNWVNYKDIIKVVSSMNFLNTQFGDIYVKFN